MRNKGRICRITQDYPAVTSSSLVQKCIWPGKLGVTLNNTKLRDMNFRLAYRKSNIKGNSLLQLEIRQENVIFFYHRTVQHWECNIKTIAFSLANEKPGFGFSCFV